MNIHREIDYDKLTNTMQQSSQQFSTIQNDDYYLEENNPKFDIAIQFEFFSYESNSELLFYFHPFIQRFTHNQLQETFSLNEPLSNVSEILGEILFITQINPQQDTHNLIFNTYEKGLVKFSTLNLILNQIGLEEYSITLDAATPNFFKKFKNLTNELALIPVHPETPYEKIQILQNNLKKEQEALSFISGIPVVFEKKINNKKTPITQQEKDSLKDFLEFFFQTKEINLWNKHDKEELLEKYKQEQSIRYLLLNKELGNSIDCNNQSKPKNKI